MFKTKKINKINITPVVNQKFDPKTVHGYEWFHNPYNNVAVVGRTRVGKTNVVYRVLESTIQPKTNVIIFCPSVNTDGTYKLMKKMLKKKKVNLKVYEHFQEDGVNHIENLVDLLGKDDMVGNGGNQEEVRGKIDLSMDEILFGDNPTVVTTLDKNKEISGYGKPKKIKKPKGKLSPEYVIIIDDLTSLCRDKSITRLLCKSRHMKMRIFINIHSITDLMPAAFGQLSNILLFPNINRDRIEQISEKCGLTFKEDTNKRSVLWDLYEDATKEPYNFLYCDTRDMEYKKNFDEIYQV